MRRHPFGLNVSAAAIGEIHRKGHRGLKSLKEAGQCVVMRIAMAHDDRSARPTVMCASAMPQSSSTARSRPPGRLDLAEIQQRDR
jgi:hypothetical protein